VKRFLNSQLLGGCLSSDAIELLVCAAFFKDYMGAGKSTKTGDMVPSSGNRGFVSFLRFLAEWEWTRGTDIPIYAIAKAEAASTNENGLTNESQLLETQNENEGGLMTTGTSYHLRTALDPSGVVFTSPACSIPGPSPVVARRIREIAKSAYGYIVAKSGSGVGSHAVRPH
jgi:hypothetical protein